MPIIATIVLAPAAKVLVQVEAGFAMAELDIGKPFGDDVEESSIDSDCRAYYGHNNPALSSFVRLSYPVSPVEAAGVPKPSISLSARFSAQLFSCRVLHPVCVGYRQRLPVRLLESNNHTNGCKVLLDRR